MLVLLSKSQALQPSTITSLFRFLFGPFKQAITLPDSPIGYEKN